MGDGQRDGAQRGFHALQGSPDNGINYDRLIAVASAEKTARLEANATASLTLYCDAQAKNERCIRSGIRDGGATHG